MPVCPESVFFLGPSKNLRSYNLQWRAIWKRMEDPLFRAIFLEFYAFWYSPTQYNFVMSKITCTGESAAILFVTHIYLTYKIVFTNILYVTYSSIMLMTPVDDECCWWQVSDVGDGLDGFDWLVPFCYRLFLWWPKRRHQHSKIVPNITVADDLF